MVKDDYPIRVLYVNGGTMDLGGITSYMMNYYRHFDDSRFRVDFLTQGDGSNLYTDEIMKRNGRVFQIPNKRKDVASNIYNMKKIMLEGRYTIVHAHSDIGNGVVLAVAKKAGISIRISHSHSTGVINQSIAQRTFSRLQKPLIQLYATDLWGCSREACSWLYGKKEATIIHNAIDLNSYSFNQDVRCAIRKKLGVDDGTLAICQIGHLNYVKNHQFSLEVISKLVEKKQRVRFFIIGNGENSQFIQEEVKRKKLGDVVSLLGNRTDVNQLLQAMDVLYMPSIFEGFPVTLVEGQATGIKCLVSDTVTHEANLVPENTIYLPITGNDSIQQWVENTKPVVPRVEKSQELTKAGFNIEFEANRLMDKYESLLNIR